MTDETTPASAIQPDRRFALIEERLGHGDARMDRIEDELRKNTAMTADSQSGIAELLGIFNSIKGGFKVLGWLGTAFKWIAFYYALKGGGPHP